MPESNYMINGVYASPPPPPVNKNPPPPVGTNPPPPVGTNPPQSVSMTNLPPAYRTPQPPVNKTPPPPENKIPPPPVNKTPPPPVNKTPPPPVGTNPPPPVNKTPPPPVGTNPPPPVNKTPPPPVNKTPPPRVNKPPPPPVNKTPPPRANKTSGNTSTTEGTGDTTEDDTTGGTTTTSTRTETTGTDAAPTGTSASEISTTEGDAASVRDPGPRPRKSAEKPKEPAPCNVQTEVKNAVIKPVVRPRVCKRLILLARNAEQMDKLFPDWSTKNFVDGKYLPTDLNQPRFLPIRRNPVTAYQMDPPLTEMGSRMAEMIGQALAAKGVEFSAVYSSPALRCIQTAQRLLKGQSIPSKIRVENALYDFCGAKDSFLPHFMDAEELEANQIPVDRTYRSSMPESDMARLAGAETPEQFLKRSSEVVKKISKYHSMVGAVLVVTHAPVMHFGGRFMCHKRATNGISPSELQRIAFSYPYCSTIALEPTSEGGVWKQCPSIVPQMRFEHYSNRFNHAYFDRKE